MQGGKTLTSTKKVFFWFFLNKSCRRRSVSSCDWSRRATRTASSTTTCPSSRRASSRSDAPRTSTSQKSSKSSLTKKIRETRTFWADGKCQFSPFNENIFVPFRAKNWCIKVFVYRLDNNLQHVFFLFFFQTWDWHVNNVHPALIFSAFRTQCKYGRKISTWLSS